MVSNGHILITFHILTHLLCYHHRNQEMGLVSPSLYRLRGIRCIKIIKVNPASVKLVNSTPTPVHNHSSSRNNSIYQHGHICVNNALEYTQHLYISVLPPLILFLLPLPSSSSFSFDTWFSVSTGWFSTPDPPASLSRVLGLQHEHLKIEYRVSCMLGKYSIN